MRILHHGKTDGFILLRSLLFSAAFLVLLSAALTIMTFIFLQSSEIKTHAEKIINNRNNAALEELHER